MATTITKPKKAARTKQAAKTRGSKQTTQKKPADNASPAETAPAQPDDSQSLVVFAFRLTRAERDLIHKAAGSAKASKFVRELALAAARGDMKAIEETLNTIRKSDQ